MAKKNPREESVASIKDAALLLFARKGYANASLEDVAWAADFTKGAVYYYFKSKENLLLEILNDIEERSIGATDAAVRNLQGSVVDKITLFNTLQANWAVKCPNDLALLMLTSIESALKPGTVTERVGAIYAKIGKLLTDIIDEGKAQGTIRQPVATEDVVLGISAVHDGNMLLWYRSGCHPGMGRKLALAARHMSLGLIQGISVVKDNASKRSAVK